MTDITVKLDTSGNPAVTCTPSTFNANQGNQQVKWKPGGSTSFTFSSLAGLPDPPFSDLNVGSTEITVQDNDQGAADYPYKITVMAGGVSYSTETMTAGASDPMIKNK